LVLGGNCLLVSFYKTKEERIREKAKENEEEKAPVAADPQNNFAQIS